MPHVEFTGNYQDLSTDKGYQFKFFCEKCGNGYMSTFQASKLGLATSALEAANTLFGGLFGRAASTAYEIQRAVGGPAHDAALDEATQEIRPLFEQCTRCGNWICRPVCWNDKAGLCEACAPDLAQELAAAQAEAAREQVQQKARETDWTKGLDTGQAVTAQCAGCRAELPAGAKFCAECGAPVQSVRKFCTGCGKPVEGAPKFCAECGEKLG